MSDLSLSQIISSTLRNINQRPEYLALRQEIIDQIGKLVLNPDKYLHTNRTCYQFTVDSKAVGLSDSLLTKTLSQESFLQPAILAGGLSFDFDYCHYLVLKFKFRYIDDLIAAAKQ